ncbi:MAG TPA: histidine phosphatase family protein [Gaiellaceae bacterium]
MSRLILVRHAEPVDDMRGRCYGSLDVGLSPEGMRTAKRLTTLESDVVYSSPRIRALDTARAIADDVRIDDDLRELDFGELEGRTYDEIAANEPELYRAWMERPTTVTFPGGESFALLKERALAALERIRSAHDCAVVVTHGGIIRAALAEWLSMPDKAIFRLDQSHCGITIVDFLDGVPVVRLVNGATLPDGAPAPSMTD